jgi:N-acetylglucosaminyl-diphospho-decaprenol L-rhamnosyltransferase
VVVTVNIPEESLVHYLKEADWPFDLTVLQNDQAVGYGENHNNAFKYCSTPWFAVVNPDIRLPADPFPALLASFSIPKVGLAYPLQQEPHKAAFDVARELPTPFALMRRYCQPSSRSSDQSKDWVNGAFMLFSSQVFRRLSGFDIQYFMYCEDVDICLRLQLQGHSVQLAQQATVFHVAQRATRRSLKHLFWHVASLFRLWSSRVYVEFKNNKR